MKVVDLTLPIGPHWRYGLEQTTSRTFEDGSRTQHTRYTLQSHWFTHIDAPRHYVPGGETLEHYPLDMFIGPATVLDVSSAADNEPIDDARLAQALGGRTPHSIVLVKSSRAAKCDWRTEAFWDDSPYITTDGAVWLRETGAKVVGFDFPQDHDIRTMRTRGEEAADMTTHDELLAKGVILIEYLTNMWLFDEDEVRFVGLPLNVQNSDGAQIRAVAIIE